MMEGRVSAPLGFHAFSVTLISLFTIKHVELLQLIMKWIEFFCNLKSTA